MTRNGHRVRVSSLGKDFMSGAGPSLKAQLLKDSNDFSTLPWHPWLASDAEVPTHYRVLPLVAEKEITDPLRRQR